MSQTNKIEVIKFQATIPALTDDVLLTERIKGDGTVVEVSGKFYTGQVLNLQLVPKLKKGNGLFLDLYTYPANTKRYISGDNQEFNDPMSFEVVNDDEIYLYCSNKNAFACDVSLTVTVDHYGGKRRVV